MKHLAAGRAVKHIPVHIFRSFLPPLPSRTLLYLLGGGAFAWAFFRARKARARGEGKLLGRLGGCLLVSLLPTLSLGVSETDTQGERFLYLASAFACLALAALLRRIRKGRILLAGALLGGSFLLLQGNHRAWRHAGRISRDLTARLLQCPPGKRVFLLNLPEKLRGAYIAPGTTPSLALEWLYPGPDRPRLFLGIHQELSSPGEAVLARREGRTFRLRFPRGAPGRLRKKAARLGFLRVLEFSPEGLTFQVPGLREGDLVFYFSRGKLHSL